MKQINIAMLPRRAHSEFRYEYASGIFFLTLPTTVSMKRGERIQVRTGLKLISPRSSRYETTLGVANAYKGTVVLTTPIQMDENRNPEIVFDLLCVTERAILYKSAFPVKMAVYKQLKFCKKVSTRADVSAIQKLYNRTGAAEEAACQNEQASPMRLT